MRVIEDLENEINVCRGFMSNRPTNAAVEHTVCMMERFINDYKQFLATYMGEVDGQCPLESERRDDSIKGRD
jgi:hypothetical protein